MIIAVDFDGTLYLTGPIGTAVPPIPNRRLIRVLKALKAEGHKLILWTCRTPGFGLEEAVLLSEGEGISWDAVNENLPETLARWTDCRKILADIYVDDRALSMPGAMGWLEERLLAQQEDDG